MARYYGMNLEIRKYDPDRLEAIQDAVTGIWSFTRTELVPEEQPVIRAYAEDCLCGGETEDEFALRLAAAVWDANAAYCPVEVTATYLEDLPCEIHEFGEAEYAEYRESKRQEDESRPCPAVNEKGEH